MPLYSDRSCASIFHKLLKMNLKALSGRDSFQQIVEEKPPDNVQFQQLFQNSGYTAVTVLKAVTKRDGNAMIQYFRTVNGKKYVAGSAFWC